MALILCSECGLQVSDKAETCPHCGAPITALDISKCKSLSITWEGKRFSLNKKNRIFVNGNVIGEFETKESFCAYVPITSSKMEIEIKGEINFKKTLNLELTQSYHCEIDSSGISLYYLSDSEFDELEDDSLSIFNQIVSFLVLPLGLIIWLMKRENEPTSASCALRCSLYGLLCSTLLYLFLFFLN